MTSTNDSASASPDDPAEAQFGPHRFPGEGGGSEQYRGARFDVADLRDARFTDCDLTGVTIRDCWLVNVNISGYLSNVTVNGIDVTDFVNAELDRRHPERVQFREGLTADDVRAIWDTIERLWAQATERASRLPAAALDQQVNEEWSFAQTLRHLVFITDAWASRTVLDEEMPYHRLGLPQSWYPAADAAVLGIDLSTQPGYADILAGPRRPDGCDAAHRGGPDRRRPGTAVPALACSRLPGGGAHRDRLHRRGDGRGDGAPPVRRPRPGRAGSQLNRPVSSSSL